MIQNFPYDGNLFDVKPHCRRKEIRQYRQGRRFVFQAPAKGEIELIGGKGHVRRFSYRADIESLAGLSRLPLHIRIRDWTHLAFSLHMADRLAPRICVLDHHGDGTWARDINLTIGVRDLSFWNRPDVQTALVNALSFLTGDIWTIHFGQISLGDFSEVRQLRIVPKDGIPEFGGAALFSGGLDSFAGTAHYGQTGSQPLMLIGGASSSRMEAGQKRQFSAFESQWPSKFYGVQIPYRFEDKRDYDKHDITQRSRGFLHTSLGLIACHLSGIKTLSIFENGIGVINLPMDASQVGQQASRPVNPVFLDQMEHLAEMITDQPIKFSLPYLLHTKAELLRLIKSGPVLHAIPETFSCDHFPDYHEGAPQCGTCTSCILRQMALEHSGIGNELDNQTYANRFEDIALWNSEKRLGFWKMDEFCTKLEKMLSSENPAKEFFTQYPMLKLIRPILAKSEKCTPEEFTHGIARLLHVHCHEWRNFTGTQAFQLFLNKRNKAA